jgi:opacity protein-like surface antigen
VLKRIGFTICLTACIIVLAAAPVAAQGLEGRGFIGGLAGATFGTASGSGVLGLQGGLSISSGIHLIGEFGRFMDVLPSDLGDVIDALESEFEDEFGVPVTIDVSVPATYGFAGLRWSRGLGRVAPFVEGGIGAARVTVTIREASIGGIDFSGVFDEVTGEVAPTAIEFLFAVGGGVNVGMTDMVSVDAGYRFARIATDDPNANVSAIYGAVKIGW